MPIMKGKLMFFDEVAWDKSDAQLATWKTTLLNEESLKKITTLIKTHRQGVSDHLFPPQKGSFNMVIRLRFIDGASAIIRFPIPGYSIFPDEKLRHDFLHGIQVYAYIGCFDNFYRNRWPNTGAPRVYYRQKSSSSALSEKIKIKVIPCHRLFADSGNSWRVFSLWLGSSDTEALPSNSLGMPGG